MIERYHLGYAPPPIAWVLACKGVRCQLHYLDNFLLIAAPYSQQGHEFLAITIQILSLLGVTVATHKTEGPTTTLVFLGILIDTDNCVAASGRKAYPTPTDITAMGATAYMY